MIERAKFPKQKDVMLITDYPVKSEITEGEKYSSISNMNLITSLRTGRINQYGKTIVDPSYKGINSINMFCTYLDYEGFEENNYDYIKEIVKGKERLEDEEYFPLPTVKDTYVHERLWNEFQKLLKEIELVQPKLIIIASKWSLFLLTACTTLGTNRGNYKDRKPLGGLNKFRSSILSPSPEWNLNYIENEIDGEIEYLSPIVIPIFHTIHAMSMPDKLSTMQLDIEKLGWMFFKIKTEGIAYYAKPVTNFTLGVDKGKIIDYMSNLIKRLDEKPTRVSVDIETKYNSMIDCIGFTDKVNEGVCIPFAGEKNPNIWTEEEEVELTLIMVEVLTHPNCLIIAQNGSYDLQFLYKLYNLDLKLADDTMIASHILYNYLPKRLDFLASLYVEKYFMWKNMQNFGKD